MKLKWKEIYSVGNKDLDEDHKQIFEYISLLESNLYKRNSAIFDEILDKLSKYFLDHFTREEKYMSEMKFDNISEHILEHQYFTDYVKKMKEKSKDFVLLSNTIDFIKDWIIAHILGSDKEYEKFKLGSTK